MLKTNLTSTAAINPGPNIGGTFRPTPRTTTCGLIQPWANMRAGTRRNVAKRVLLTCKVGRLALAAGTTASMTTTLVRSTMPYKDTMIAYAPLIWRPGDVINRELKDDDSLKDSD